MSKQRRYCYTIKFKLDVVNCDNKHGNWNIGNTSQVSADRRYRGGVQKLEGIMMFYELITKYTKTSHVEGEER